MSALLSDLHHLACIPWNWNERLAEVEKYLICRCVGEIYFSSWRTYTFGFPHLSLPKGAFCKCLSNLTELNLNKSFHQNVSSVVSILGPWISSKIMGASKAGRHLTLQNMRSLNLPICSNFDPVNWNYPISLCPWLISWIWIQQISFTPLKTY